MKVKIHDFEYTGRELIEEYSKWGVEMNRTKTVTVCIGRIQQDLLLKIRQQCDYCKYLGLEITNDDTLDHTMGDKNILDRIAISMPNGILWIQTITKTNETKNI